MSAKDERTGIAGVMEDLDDAVVVEYAPEYVAFADAATGAAGERESFSLEAPHDGGSGADLAEGAEHHPESGLDLLIRFQDHRAGGVVHQADRQWHLQLPTPCLVEDTASKPRAQDMQLRLAHRALEAEQ